jgi:hypothetical protein
MVGDLSRRDRADVGVGVDGVATDPCRPSCVRAVYDDARRTAQFLHSA